MSVRLHVALPAVLLLAAALAVPVQADESPLPPPPLPGLPPQPPLPSPLPLPSQPPLPGVPMPWAFLGCVAANAGQLAFEPCGVCWPSVLGTEPIPLVPFLAEAVEEVDGTLVCALACFCDPPGPVVGLLLPYVDYGAAYVGDVNEWANQYGDDLDRFRSEFVTWVLSLEDWTGAVSSWTIETVGTVASYLLCLLVGPYPCVPP